MAQLIFVNLPVKDLKRSAEFFTKLGYTFNPKFTDEKSTCMIISDTIYVMLLAEPFFQSFTEKELVDTSKAIQSYVCLSAESRDAVNEMVNKAVAAGGVAGGTQDEYDFMYGWDYTDLDGHKWAIMWMDPAFVNG